MEITHSYYLEDIDWKVMSERAKEIIRDGKTKWKIDELDRIRYWYCIDGCERIPDDSFDEEIEVIFDYETGMVTLHWGNEPIEKREELIKTAQDLIEGECEFLFDDIMYNYDGRWEGTLLEKIYNEYIENGGQI